VTDKKFENAVEWGIDLASEHERYLAEVHFKRPVDRVQLPKGIKAFYMRLNDDGKTVAAMDILVPGVGSSWGAARGRRYDVLVARCAAGPLLCTVLYSAVLCTALYYVQYCMMCSTVPCSDFIMYSTGVSSLLLYCTVQCSSVSVGMTGELGGRAVVGEGALAGQCQRTGERKKGVPLCLCVWSPVAPGWRRWTFPASCTGGAWTSGSLGR